MFCKHACFLPHHDHISTSGPALVQPLFGLLVLHTNLLIPLLFRVSASWLNLFPAFCVQSSRLEMITLSQLILTVLCISRPLTVPAVWLAIQLLNIVVRKSNQRMILWAWWVWGLVLSVIVSSVFPSCLSVQTVNRWMPAGVDRIFHFCKHWHVRTYPL